MRMSSRSTASLSFSSCFWPPPERHEDAVDLALQDLHLAILALGFEEAAGEASGRGRLVLDLFEDRACAEHVADLREGERTIDAQLPVAREQEGAQRLAGELLLLRLSARAVERRRGAQAQARLGGVVLDDAFESFARLATGAQPQSGVAEEARGGDSQLERLLGVAEHRPNELDGLAAIGASPRPD
jgi:hypothetical protein